MGTSHFRVKNTSYSLLLVGSTALLGTIRKSKLGQVNWRAAALFGGPAVLAVFFTRKWLVPIIPEAIQLGGFSLGRELFLLSFLALLMVGASIQMLRSPENVSLDSSPPKGIWLVVQGILIGGLVTGILGAGGGFLIIPALVFLGKVPMKMATGTSLAIISVNSLVGFLGDVGNPEIIISPVFIAVLIGISFLGLLIGVAISQKVEGSRLKRGFGLFVLVMAIFIIWKELGGGL
jgi:hypothetical protein